MQGLASRIARQGAVRCTPDLQRQGVHGDQTAGPFRVPCRIAALERGRGLRPGSLLAGCVPSDECLPPNPSSLVCCMGLGKHLGLRGLIVHIPADDVSVQGTEPRTRSQTVSARNPSLLPCLEIQHTCSCLRPGLMPCRSPSFFGPPFLHLCSGSVCAICSKGRRGDAVPRAQGASQGWGRACR